MPFVSTYTQVLKLKRILIFNIQVGVCRDSGSLETVFFPLIAQLLRAVWGPRGEV